MAIPLSNEQKVVQAPQTANLQPMDNQQLFSAMGNAALATNRQMQETIQGSFKFADKIRLQNDALKRNKAEREYNERTSKLNEELGEKEGEERQKFQPKYEAEMKLASDKYEAEINRVGDFEIREGSKRSISAWNTRNASNYQYENHRNDQNLREKAMGQAIISGNQKRVTAITAADTENSLWDLYNDPDLGFAHEEQLIRDFYGNDKGMPSDVVDQYVKDYKAKAMIAMANRLAQVTDDVNSNNSYEPSLRFLDRGIKSGAISPEEAIAAKRALETQKLTMIAETQPGLLINADGSYKFDVARHFAPDLTKQELYRHIKTGSSNSGSGGATGFQEDLSRTAIERWNATVSGMGFVNLATDKYKEQNKGLFEGQDNVGKIRGKKLYDLVKIVTLGDTMLNGKVVLESDGSISELQPGETAQTIKARGANIVSRKMDKELYDQVMQAKTDLTAAVLDGSYADVFDPRFFAASKDATYQEKAFIAQLANIKRAYPSKSGWMSLTAKKVINRLGIHDFDTQIMNNLTRDVVDEALKGAQIGLGEAQRKYNFDSETTEDIGETTVHLKRWNPDTKKYEQIPDAAPVTLNEAVGLEIALGTMRRMDDGMFHTIYGQGMQRPKSIEDLHYGGYNTDWMTNPRSEQQAAAARKMQTLSSFNPMSKIFGNFGFPQPEATTQPKGVANFLNLQGIDGFKKALGDNAPEQTQFLSEAFSGKPDNSPLSYGEYAVSVGEATPESYRGYLGCTKALDRTMRTVNETNALDQSKPGHFFLSVSPKTDRLINDMYKKTIGAVPADAKYIGEDITTEDVLKGDLVEYTAPKKAMGPATYNDKFDRKKALDGAPIFISTSDGRTYVINKNQIKYLDARHKELVNLLGVMNEYGNPNASQPTPSEFIGGEVAEDFKYQ